MEFLKAHDGLHPFLDRHYQIRDEQIKLLPGGQSQGLFPVAGQENKMLALAGVSIIKPLSSWLRVHLFNVPNYATTINELNRPT
jgi:hypothetical protein